MNIFSINLYDDFVSGGWRRLWTLGSDFQNNNLSCLTYNIQSFHFKNSRKVTLILSPASLPKHDEIHSFTSSAIITSNKNRYYLCPTDLSLECVLRRKQKMHK